MTDPLAQWEQAHPAAARALWSLLTPTSPAPPGAGSEARVQSAVRLEAANKGYWLGRNNSGALLDQRGVPVRFGLGNESARVNAVMKSADLIGIGPSGQFVSVEVKRPGGRVEPGQIAWAALVCKRGGLGLIVDREGMLP
jgi:hypothetical protein